MAKKSRTIVGDPLTPASLKEMNALEGFTTGPENFNPESGWTNTYRVWTNHGYSDDGLKDVGFLTIKRRASIKAKSPAILEVEQQIVNDAAQIHRIRAGISCASQTPLASPLEWELDSEFIGPDGKPVSGLGLSERGLARGKTIKIETAGKTFKRKGSKRLASDWGLYDAVQRLPFEEGSSLRCDLLEEMSVLREDVEISYRGTVPNPVNPGESLHCFQQLSEGILPYEYYLDSRHRLVLAITFSVAFILDPDAEKKTREAFKRSLDYVRQRAARNEEGK